MTASLMGRVVVTGMGVIGPHGFDAEAMFQRLCRGESGIRRITHFDTSLCPSKIGGTVQGFELTDFVSDRPTLRSARLMESTQHWALCAAQLALRDAGLEESLDPAVRADAPLDPKRLGVCLGAGLAGRTHAENSGRRFIRIYNEAARRALKSEGIEAWLAENEDTMLHNLTQAVLGETNPATLLQQCPSVTTAFIAMRYGAMGPNTTIVSLCAASAQAIGEAACMIARGDADAMLAGGADSMLNLVDLFAFARLDAVSGRNDEVEGACKPFDLRRDGCVVGEGAAMLLLESAEGAARRGARVLAELVGYGSTDDAYRISAPPEDGEGARLAMQRALDSAGLAPEAIDHINAHGTSTMLNDRIETLAIRRVFGRHAERIPVVSTKSMTGHLIAAAGALEAVISIKSLEHRRVPPTINLRRPDPRCDLDYVPEGTRAVPHLNTVLSNSFAIGGVNATLIFQRAGSS